MPSFTVSIIGRPNVGKSTLFNAIVGEKISIVEPTAGVTRDRVLRTIKHDGKKWDLIDTGGIGIIDNDKLSEEIEFQLELSISQADLVLFVVDVQAGIIPDDHRIANELRKANKNVLLITNKVDDQTHETSAQEFYALSLGEPILISAKAYRGVRSLKSRISELAPFFTKEEEALEEDRLRIAVVGRRNVGKSSFINYISGEERVIVSNQPGTTRDSIDVAIEHNGKKFVIVDTAGMRKKTKYENAIEFFSACRTERAIKKANIVFLFLDSIGGISNVDQKLAKLIQEDGKNVILVTTKIDLAKEADRMQYKKYIDHHLSGLNFAPIIFISSLTGENVWKLIDLAFDIHRQSMVEVSTSKINDILTDSQRRHPHPVVHGVRPRLFYGTQIKFGPPRFLIFVRHKKYIQQNYHRFLANEFRSRLNTPEVPYNFTFRENARTNKEQEKIALNQSPEEDNDFAEEFEDEIWQEQIEQYKAENTEEYLEDFDE